MNLKSESMILEYLSFRDVGVPLRPLFNSSTSGWWDSCLNSLDSAGMVLHFIAKLQQRGDFEDLPPVIQRRLRKNLQDQTERHACVSKEFRQFNQILQARRIQYICLKGLTKFPDFLDDSVQHLQSDHDFLVHQEDLKQAYELFLGLGFEPLDAGQFLLADHLPTLIRKNSWEWKGNPYDPDAPRAVEIHFRLWGAQHSGLTIRSLDDVWQNVGRKDIAGISVPVLSREDALTFAILHAFRHLLGNDLRLSNLYELAFFLHRNHKNERFWSSYSEKLRKCRSSRNVAAIMLHLACLCFEPETSPQVSELVARNLSPASRLWVRRYGRKEALSSYRRSKSALFLRLDFLEKQSENTSAILRRLFPFHLPSGIFLQFPEDQKSRLRRVHDLFHYFSRIINRSFFHAVSLIRFLWSYPLWKLSLIRCRSQSQGRTDSHY